MSSGAANWLANIGLSQQLTPAAELHLQYRYVGERQREAGDPRGPAPAYQTMDVTVTSSNFGYKGLMLRLGVKNLFAAKVRYPALLTTDNTGATIVGYFDDHPGLERTWWLQLAYRY